MSPEISVFNSLSFPYDLRSEILAFASFFPHKAHAYRCSICFNVDIYVCVCIGLTRITKIAPAICKMYYMHFLFFPSWTWSDLVTYTMLHEHHLSSVYSVWFMWVRIFFSQGSWIVKQSVGKKACLLGQALEINYFHGKNYLEVSLQELLFLYLCCVVWALSFCKMRARVCTRMYTHSNTCTHTHTTQASSSCSPNSITFVLIGLA